MIITISGSPGSGKSTITKLLEEKLVAERIYVGGIRRELAKEKGMTLLELNEYAKTHPETDVNIDKQVAAKARNLEKKGKTVLVEGRTQFHFLPESIKFFIFVDEEEGAKRIWNELKNEKNKEQRNEGIITSLEMMKQQVLQREEEDAARYKKYYGFDHRDKQHYDFILDTTKISVQEACEKILTYLKKKINH